jgi:hypothetical protein
MSLDASPLAEPPAPISAAHKLIRLIAKRIAEQLADEETADPEPAERGPDTSACAELPDWLRQGCRGGLCVLAVGLARLCPPCQVRMLKYASLPIALGLLWLWRRVSRSLTPRLTLYLPGEGDG